jgi:hypothetical protein
MAARATEEKSGWSRAALRSFQRKRMPRTQADARILVRLRQSRRRGEAPLLVVVEFDAAPRGAI